jgi:hypothetical protein
VGSGVADGEIPLGLVGRRDKSCSGDGLVPGAVEDRGGQITSDGRMVRMDETRPRLLWGVGCGVMELRRSGMTIGGDEDV